MGAGAQTPRKGNRWGLLPRMLLERSGGGVLFTKAAESRHRQCLPHEVSYAAACGWPGEPPCLYYPGMNIDCCLGQVHD